MFLVSPQIDEPAALAADPVAAEAVMASVPDLAQDLLLACGPVATEMIELEKAGSLTSLQAAALDALRPICSQQGIPLPEAPGPQTVQAVLPRSNPVVSSVSAGSDDLGDDWDDEHDSDDWDDEHDSDDWDD